MNRRGWWLDRFQRAGVPAQEAGALAGQIVTLEGQLRDRGVDLRSVTADELSGVIAGWPFTWTRHRLRRAVRLAAGILGRDDLPADLVPVPPMSAGTRAGWWGEQLKARGLSAATARRYGSILQRAERELGRDGTDLERATAEQLMGLRGLWPTPAAHAQARRALGLAGDVIGRADLPAVERERRAWWRAQLHNAGLATSSARHLAAVLEKAEALLDEQHVDLRTAGDSHFLILAARWPRSRGGREKLRQALTHGTQLLGRTDFDSDIIPVPPPTAERRPSRTEPLSVRQAEAFETAAWQLGGIRGLAGLLCLHTPLRGSEIAAARWEDFRSGPDGTLRLAVPSQTVELHPRLARLTAAQAGRRGWVFPHQSVGHASRETLSERVRAIAYQAGLGTVSLETLRGSQPGTVNPDMIDTLTTAELDNPDGTSGLTIEDFLACGLSERTAYIYRRLVDRFVAALAAQRGRTLMDCTGADVGAVCLLFPNANSGRGQLRGALRWAWNILGRTDPPSLRAIRIPPTPKRSSKALSHEDACRLEQAAWDRNDRHGLAILIGLYAGLRRDEIASLTWERVIRDPDDRPVWLRVHGKGDLEADVPVSTVLAEALDRAYQPGATGPIFPGRFPDRHVHANTVWTWTKQLGAEIGLPQLHTHQLRHTAITEANDATGELRIVQDFARHSRPETTAGYTRVKDSKLVWVANEIDYGRNLPGSGALPDPAAGIPSVSYRELIEVTTGEHNVAVWAELGHALADAGWIFHYFGGEVLAWVHPTDDRLHASADSRDAEPFHLSRIDFDTEKGESNEWCFASPDQLLTAAHALTSGVQVAGSVRFGPWIEQPYVDFLAGAGPCPWTADAAVTVGADGARGCGPYAACDSEAARGVPVDA